MPVTTPHIISEILNRPLLVTPDKLHAVMQVINSKNSGHLDLDLAALAPLLGTDKNGTATKAESRVVRQSEEEVKKVAIIPLIGTVISRNRGFSDSSGLRSYRTMAYELERAAADPSIVGAVLDVDTYGGAAAGCPRMARLIREFAEQKPIYANVDLNAFSAGTWITSACTKVFLADEDAGMGSVGCIAIHRDISGKNEKDGEVYTAVYFGAKKNDFSPHLPLDDALREKLQASVEKTGVAFAQGVAEYRSLKVEDVLAWEAGCFYGEDAVKVGLADGIASFSETIAMVAEDAEKRSLKTGPFIKHGGAKRTAENGGALMPISEQLQAILQEDGAIEALAEFGYISQDAAQKGQEEALAVQKQSFNTAVDLAAISDLNVLQVKSVITGDDLSAGTVSAALQIIKASDGKKEITSTTTATTQDGKNGLIAKAEKLAAKI
jgi:ClpP class serine protease